MPSPQVIVDIVEGTAVSHDIMQGWSIDRIAIVTGLNAYGTSDTATIVREAEAAVIAVTGDRGSACPNVPVPTYLKSFTPELIGATAAKVKISYKGYPLPTFEFDGSLNQVQSNKDVAGNPITLQYTYPNDYALDRQRAGRTVTQGILLPRTVPESVVTIRFIVTDGNIEGEPADATEFATWLKATYEGKMNSTTYTIRRLIGFRHQWMMEKVHCVSRDAGQSYEAAMTMHFKTETWDKTGTFIDSVTGQPPADLVDGVGQKTVQMDPDVVFPIFTFGPN